MKKIAVAAVIAATVAIAACNPSGPASPSGIPNPPFLGEPPQDAYIYQGEPGVYGGTMVLELSNELRTLNIARATDNISTYLLWYHVYRCLVDYRNGDDPPAYEAGVCTRWETSADAKEWTFYLRRGVRWSDGAPFTADDVLFTYELVRDNNIDSAVRDTFKEGRDADGKTIYPDLEKIDDHTVRFRLHTANLSFLDAIFNLYLLPKHKWEAAWRAGTFNETMKTSDDPKDAPSLGPFRIVEYVTGQRVVLERNPYFWKVDKKGQRLPYLDRLIFIIARDSNTVQAKFQAGELDVMSRVRAEDFALIKRMESAEVKVDDIGVSLDTQWIVLNQNTGRNPNTGKPFVDPWKLRLFRDQKFRQAISYAINREGLVNTVYTGRATPIYSFVSPADKNWYTDDVMKYPHQPELAKAMLAELGLKDTNGDGYLEDGEGHAIAITIITNADNSQRTKTAAFIGANLQAVGIKAVSTPVSLNTVIDVTQSSFHFDAVVLGWGSGIPPSPNNSKNILLSSGLNHICFPAQRHPSSEWEARVDKLVQEFEASADDAERKRQAHEIQRIWSEQLPEINLVCQYEAIAYKNKFGNLRPSPMAPRVTWNAEEIYVKQN